MKTAIQELKESLQSINERYELKGDADWLMNEILDLVENSLEKEREQIEAAVHRAIIGGISFPESDEVITRGRAYYNKTYDQNK